MIYQCSTLLNEQTCRNSSSPERETLPSAPVSIVALSQPFPQIYPLKKIQGRSRSKDGNRARALPAGGAAKGRATSKYLKNNHFDRAPRVPGASGRASSNPAPVAAGE